MEPRRFTGLWIPAELIENRQLSIQEKFVAAEIDALDRPNIGCTAKNQHFIDRTGLGVSRVKEIISRLASLGIIRVIEGGSKARVMRSNLAQWVADRRREAESAALTFSEQVESTSRDSGQCQNVTGRETGQLLAGIPASSDFATNTNEITVEITDKTLREKLDNSADLSYSPTPPLPLPARRGRPPKSGIISIPLFGEQPDYGPTDDAIYMACPLKARRADAIAEIQKAVVRLTKENRKLGIDESEKRARLYLLDKTCEFARHIAERIRQNPNDAKYTFHPATFFRNEEYKRDWSNAGRGNGRGLRRTAGERGQFDESADYSRFIHRSGT